MSGARMVYKVGRARAGRGFACSVVLPIICSHQTRQIENPKVLTLTSLLLAIYARLGLVLSVATLLQCRTRASQSSATTAYIGLL